MMKRWISLLLTVVLAFGICAPALAAEKDMSNFTAIRSYTDNFPDVKATDWFYSSVKTCYEYGLMEGSNGQFNPGGNLTVAQALVMADRVHSIYTTGSDSLTNGKPWYQPYVDYALANGIILEGDFASYTAEVTRAQMAYIFSRALPAEEYIPINEISSYPPDVDAAQPYAENILTLLKAGIVTGNDSYGTFRPDAPIARREAAAIIARIAIREQRKNFVMMRDVKVDDKLTLLAPVGAELKADGEGEYELEHGFLYVQITAQKDSAYEGASILQIPSDTLAELLSTSMETAFPGSTVSAGAEVTAFGDVPAYLLDYDFEASEEILGTVKAQGYTYFFIAGDTMYSINFVTACPGAEIPAELAAEQAAMVNGLTVGGKASVVKIK